MVAGFNNDIEAAIQVDAASGRFVANPVINAFFNRQVARYLSTSGDLTTSRAFALLDNADDRLMLGVQLASNDDISEFTRWVVSAGVKADIKKGFSTVFKDGEAQADLGGVLKVTWVARGLLGVGKKGSSLANERAAWIAALTQVQAEKAKKAAKAWGEERLAIDAAAGLSESAEVRDKERQAQLKKLTGDMARATALQIEEKEHYRSFHTWWFSAEGYTPFSPTRYHTVDSVTAALWDTHELLAWEGKLSGTFLHTGKYLGAKFLTAWVGYLNNNNILSTQLTTTSASTNATNSQGDTLALVQLDGKETVGIGDYARFDTFKLGGRAVWMFLPWMGVSAEVEQWIGDYDPVNWKLGIPVALKNEKGDRAINFELQWREQLNVHSLGVSVGLPFGGSLYK